MHTVITGTLAGTGSFRCEDCDYVVTLQSGDVVPPCPWCSGTSFVRASMFAMPAADNQPAPPAEDDDWLGEARAELTEPGAYAAYHDRGRLVVVPLVRQWTRVGRSLAADIRLDDPTVSRRHALIVHQHDGVRILDDRSLNGVYVNGHRVEWSSLHDGDEILVGRFHLRFLEVSAMPEASRFVRASRGEAA